jgi:hypothetical protein
MQNARQHHYVQARYLDGFLSPPNNKLWCYGRRRFTPYPAVPDKLARQRDFYRIPGAPPAYNLENFIEKGVEAPGLLALRKLVRFREPLDFVSRVHLAKYIAFQEVRVPHTRELIREQTSQSINHMLQRFQETGGTSAIVQDFALAEGTEIERTKPIAVTREEIESFAKKIADNPDSFDLHDMVELAKDVAIIYTTMRWTILFAGPDAAFVTSDCPVFRTFLEPGGDDALIRPDCSVCCPLSSKALLVMDHDHEFLQISMRERIEGSGQTLAPTLFRTIPDAGVLNFNRNIVDYSHLWSFSGTEHNWITKAMQQPSKRNRPSFFAHGEVSGARWRRSS